MQSELLAKELHEEILLLIIDNDLVGRLRLRFDQEEADYVVSRSAALNQHLHRLVVEGEIEGAAEFDHVVHHVEEATSRAQLDVLCAELRHLLTNMILRDLLNLELLKVHTGLWCEQEGQFVATDGKDLFVVKLFAER